jgi:hypothetical protein
MSISRVKSPDWGLNEILTSAQANALDTNVTNALDKRSGQTDTLASVVTESGAGRIIKSLVEGADADTTYLVSGANHLIELNDDVIGATRTYTLSNTNASNGDEIRIYSRAPAAVTDAFAGKIIVKNAAATTLIEIGPDEQAMWAAFRFNDGFWSLAEYGSKRDKLVSQTFTANGTFTVPDGVTEVAVYGVGAGGGGGGGGGGETTTSGGGGGGGGGGGKLGVQQFTGLTPGAGLAVVVGTAGAAGSGGNVGAAGADGGNGGNSTFDAVVVGRGGQGGAPGARGNTARYAYGGMPFVHSVAQAALVTGTTTLPALPHSGQGGVGYNVSSSDPQLAKSTYGGGTGLNQGGAPGTGFVTASGGGAGGGGGASEWPSGTGAAGGNGSAVGVGGPGSSGTANTGGGGGGGGGGNINAEGGAGGAGGSGAVRVVWIASA